MRSLVLGIECTAHTFGVGVVETTAKTASSISPKNTQLLANEAIKYPSLNEGYVPRKLADFHAKNAQAILEAAFSKAKRKPSQLSGVAYSYGPGLGHSLRVAHVAAKSLSVVLGIPMVPVNHALAHLEIGRFYCNEPSPLVVYVSGGNTQILSREGGHYRVLGETLDLGVGNFLDHLGRDLKLQPPDAIGILTEAKKATELLDLPFTVKAMNVSFTGLQTSLRKLQGKESNARICFSAQEYAFSMLLEAVERALVLTKRKAVLLVGGNARNKRLQEMLSLLCEEHKVECSIVPFEYAGDNGLMIAYNGLQRFLSGRAAEKQPDQKVRIEQEEILW